jgi:protein-S-isoprenylcysteine O-methyltransferase Ste14
VASNCLFLRAVIAFLARIHGDAWRAYAASVPRWFGFPVRPA